MRVSIIAYASPRGFSGGGVRNAMKSGRIITSEAEGIKGVDKVAEQLLWSLNIVQLIVLPTSFVASKVIDAVDNTIRYSFNANLDGVSFGVSPVTLALNLDYPLMMSANRLSLLASGDFAGKVGDALDRSKNNKSHLVYWAIQA